MFSKEFMKHLGAEDVKVELKETTKEASQIRNSMFYLILKSSGTVPKKA